MIGPGGEEFSGDEEIEVAVAEGDKAGGAARRWRIVAGGVGLG